MALQKSSSLEQLALDASHQLLPQHRCDISPPVHGDKGSQGAVLCSSIHGEWLMLMLRLQLVSPCWLFRRAGRRKPFPTFPTNNLPPFFIRTLKPQPSATFSSNHSPFLAIFGCFFTCVPFSVRPRKLPCLCAMSSTSLQRSPKGSLSPGLFSITLPSLMNTSRLLLASETEENTGSSHLGYQGGFLGRAHEPLILCALGNTRQAAIPCQHVLCAQSVMLFVFLSKRTELW